MTVIHKSPYEDVEILEVPITEFVLRRADELSDKPAFIEGASGRVVTFGDLKELIHRFAGGLASRGFGPGDTLALVSPNLPEYAVAFHGTAVAGGTVTTVNPTYGAEEIRFQLNDANASILVTIEAAIPIALEAIEGTDVTEIIVIGEHENATSLSEVVSADPIEQVPVDLSSQAIVLPYSSGTTGLPKGVMLTHRNLVANLCQCNGVIDYDPEASGLAVLPFFHIYGMQVLMNGLLANGCTVISMPRFDLVEALTLIQTHKITHFFAVPPMILALAKHPVIDNFDLSSLDMVLSGAAPLGSELAEEAAARINCEVIQAYGMTELSPATHITPTGQYRPGSVGVTVPNAECRIVDPETGEDQDIGGEGELWIRGPMVMAGYLNNPEATAITIDEDGWLHTGDVATVDDQQHFYIVDRVKELIKFKGFQVPPAELEAIIITHPSVADVAVIGVPDDEAGELPKAFVTLKPDMEATATDIKDFVADKVATYKQVHLVEFIDEIPKSASGKILRRFLRDRS
ncbi:MAG: 4-coumarate--CoA ligase family protein [Acidimicrobiaceae bacterium]|nr:4-coumarate--CoA ligase family protein [Acidimicrobiaceae bacterium]